MTALGDIRFDPVTPDPLVAFLAAHAASPADTLLAAIRAEVQAGGGDWMEPDMALQSRPATHLFEITLHGVPATGFTAAEAATHWRKVALRTLFPEAA